MVTSIEPNSFSSPDPQFPCQSREAAEQLGIPDSPEIHLAITSLAERFLEATRTIDTPLEVRRARALRVASGAVLFGWDFESSLRELSYHLDLPYVGELPRPWISNDKDWLADAAHLLRAAGVQVNPKFQLQRTNYGWSSIR